jgi:hypothetical protein
VAVIFVHHALLKALPTLHVTAGGAIRQPQRVAKRPARWIRAGLVCGPVHSPFCLRLRDQIRLKVSPSSTRLAYIGTVKLGSSSLTDR